MQPRSVLGQGAMPSHVTAADSGARAGSGANAPSRPRSGLPRHRTAMTRRGSISGRVGVPLLAGDRFRNSSCKSPEPSDAQELVREYARRPKIGGASRPNVTDDVRITALIRPFTRSSAGVVKRRAAFVASPLSRASCRTSCGCEQARLRRPCVGGQLRSIRVRLRMVLCARATRIRHCACKATSRRASTLRFLSRPAVRCSPASASRSLPYGRDLRRWFWSFRQSG